MPSMMIDKVQTAKKVCPVIFLLDSSDSMGSPNNEDSMNDTPPIYALNNAVENLLTDLNDFNSNSSSVEVRMAILSFNSKAQWLVGETALLKPNEVRDTWRDLKADGLTCMGDAFKKLREKLSRNSDWFKQIRAPLVAPLLMLFSDGEPTDDYKQGLRLLNDNRLYNLATRVAIGYGDDNREILCAFTKNSDTVFHADTLLDLQKLINLTTITSLKSNVAPQMLNNQNNDFEDTTPKFAEQMKAQGVLDAIGNENWEKLPE